MVIGARSAETRTASVRLDAVGDDQACSGEAETRATAPPGKHAMGHLGGDRIRRRLPSARTAALQSVPAESNDVIHQMQRVPATSPMMFMTSEVHGALAALSNDREVGVHAAWRWRGRGPRRRHPGWTM